MDLQDLKKPGSLILWTRQAADILNELREHGIYRVKREYIEKKNDTISEYYLKLYRWYTQEARKYICLPREAEYPVWLSVNEDNMLQPTPGTVILKAEVPADQYIYCNYDGWGYCVNYWYVPFDEEDKKRHEQELKRYGLKSDDELLLTDKGNFYPLLKRKVQESWKRIFTLLPKDEVTGLVATSWQLRQEWIREVRCYDK